MYYFITENVFGLNSGTKHAAARRTNLFNAEGERAYYVSRNYNRFLSRDLANIGLNPQESINMYDFFSGHSGRATAGAKSPPVAGGSAE
ncbi:hypothetical protein [Lacticaseibacillus thailandensis]|uniref:hypothetical protein n=1 Tax=Lacticaseibacillus thailandensis TaxID=381741 RepID=UPI0006CF6103|nr:hypothetical protein [Lacticaseibacillus thailandensis]